MFPTWCELASSSNVIELHRVGILALGLAFHLFIFCVQVEGLMRLMEGEHVGPFNLGNPGEFTMLELAKVKINLHA